MRHYLSILGLLLCTSLAFGQDGGKVTVIKNPAIDSLIARRIALNKVTSGNGSPYVMNGYRVQIFFGTDRKEAYAQQAKFKSLYPELDTYLSYTQPNYRVKIGDFRTRAQAQKMMNELRSNFPSLFIFNEKINPIKADKFDADQQN
ncbi:MAG: SPOR domain-containing protein [Sphingobacteriales bacterium]|nr:SPOR domain-containing protein [Sphingobacteriales bacterium]